MTTLVSHPDLKTGPGTLSPEHLAGLARTFADSAHPVWIHDLSGRCVYRNRAASQGGAGGDRVASHEIFGSDNRRIGQLRVGAA